VQFRDLLVPTPIASNGTSNLGRGVVVDLIVSVVSWLLVGASAAGFVNHIRIGDFSTYSTCIAFAVPYGVLITLLGYSEGLYATAALSESLPSRRWILAKCTVQTTLIMGIANVFAKSTIPTPICVLIGGTLNFLGLALVRGWHGSDRGPKNKTNVLVVGAGPTGRAIARHLRHNPQLGRVVRGFLDNTTVPAFGVLGPTSALSHIARAEFADEVIIANAGDASEMQHIAQEARAQHLDVRVVAHLPLPGSEPWIENWDGFPLITLHREHLPLGALTFKRAIDLVAGGFLLTLLSPLLLVVAILIRLDSDGPSIYAAERVGRKGRKFRCYKFRTMVRNADREREQLRSRNEREGPCFKLCNDPRVTRIGRFLRRYSLDELPQLWNVIRGEMSLVGPRPHPVDDCARYDLPHLRRLDATQGMTGLWQISAREAASFDTNLQLDLDYIEHWSLGLDLTILAKTLAVVVRGTGT